MSMMFLGSLRINQIRVHMWGGFGSQLNALAFAISVKRRWPRKRVVLVTHTSGVTFRDSEISAIIPDYLSIEYINDYNENVEFNKKRKTLRLLSKFLNYLHILILPDSKSELSRLKFWTLSVRSHYSYNPIEDNSLNQMWDLLSLQNGSTKSVNAMLHYRLGDLLTIEKEYIAPEVLVNLMKTLMQTKWVIFSDSPSDASEKLKIYLPKNQQFTFLKSSSIDVLRQGVSSNIFVGTNSKLSAWIVIFRTFQNKESFVSKNLAQTLSVQIPEYRSKMIHFFS